MKKFKKFASLVLAVMMVLSMGFTALAQEVPVGSGKGSITISNAAKGETYTIYKLFDATVNENGTSIAYTGDIPDALSAYFTKTGLAGVESITDTEAAWTTTESGEKVMSESLRNALKTWAASASATSFAVSDGSTLIFKNIPYGYYVVTTSQGQQVISVDSTKPTATIVDKNYTTPSNLTKTVDDDDVFIGQTVTYTVNFKTSNYDGAGEAAKKIVSYTIEDTLPEWLTSVNVTSIIVDNDGDAATTNDQVNVTAQFTSKKITIDWYDDEKSSFMYDNGATITITYTAVVTDYADIDGDGNTNTVTVTWDTEDGPNPGKLEESEVIYTYAIALKKVNDKGNALSGAVFQFPFYVKETADTTDGAYIYAGTTAGEGLTNQLTTPTDGVIIIKGVATGTYSITEVTAPNGYNKLLENVSVTATKTGAKETHTTKYLDENGNVVDTETQISISHDSDKISAATVFVVNKTGVELPSTGGIGTTIFYVLGGILVLAAGVILVTRRRMNMGE